MKSFKLAVCQTKTTENKKVNIKRALDMINEAADNGAEVVVLGEMFNCPYQNDYFVKFAETYPGETSKAMMEVAKEKNIILIAGSIAEKDGDRIYNTSYAFDGNGQLLAFHRKVHLFDLDIPGKIYFKESDTFTAGNRTTVFDTKFGKFAIFICFDIRFPEIFAKATREGAEFIFVPAAFNMTTGPAHWEISNRMRALDNGVFLCGACPARNIDASYICYGNSRICDPWGQVIAAGDENEMILYADIDGSYLDKVRKQLPLAERKRPELYI